MLVKIFWDGDATAGMGRPVAREIADILQLDVELEENPIMLTGYSRHRDQFDAGQILQRISLYKRRHGIDALILLVTGKDLYARGWDFVYGLAKAAYGAAVVSTARMEDGFYRMEEDLHALCMRTAKEGAHEICHLFGLSHCEDPTCIMFPPETRDQLDRKSTALCPVCRQRLNESIASCEADAGR